MADMRVFDVIKKLWQGWASTNGAGHVVQNMGLGVGIAINRIDTSITTTRRRMDFGSNGPTEINVRLKDGTAGNRAFIVVNADSTQHADNELADPPNQDATTERKTVYETNIQPDGIIIFSEVPITHIDYLLDNAGTSAELIVEGA